jgi:hypothetical protein
MKIEPRGFIAALQHGMLPSWTQDGAALFEAGLQATPGAHPLAVDVTNPKASRSTRLPVTHAT